MILFVRNFVELLVMVVWLLVLVRVLLSWVDPMGRGSLARYVVGLTEPMLAPIRRALPSTGAVDFSPVILMLVLAVILQFISV